MSSVEAFDLELGKLGDIMEKWAPSIEQWFGLCLKNENQSWLAITAISLPVIDRSVEDGTDQV